MQRRTEHNAPGKPGHAHVRSENGDADDDTGIVEHWRERECKKPSE